MSKHDERFLVNHGSTLLDNGYNVIPIPPGSKQGAIDGWRGVVTTPKLLKEWIRDNPRYGIGITTKETSAIDLDISDPRLTQKMYDFIRLNFGDMPTRVGRKPKMLLLARVEEPIRKMKSGKFLDEWGMKHEVEILGDGQQFVAYGIHPDTQQPYTWITEADPINTPVDELIVLTIDDCNEIIDYFIQCCEEEEMTRVTNRMAGGLRQRVDVGDDDFMSDFETTVDMSTDEIREQLLMVPGAEDYDRWTEVGMALYHQFDGNDEGLALWHEWSETAANYEADALNEKWESGTLLVTGKGVMPITARTILKLAKDAAETKAAQTVVELKQSFIQAKTAKDWQSACADTAKSEIDPISRSALADLARKRYIEITENKIPLSDVRKALAYKLPSNDRAPKWCQDWIYNASNTEFFHVKMKVAMSHLAFDSVYGRHAFTPEDIVEKRSTPSMSPCALALNRYRIETVYSSMYKPGADDIFEINGLKMVNTYSEHTVPEPPDELRPIDKKSIERVRAHIAHLLPDEGEQAIFLNWLAYLVQNPGKKMNWAMVLQGTQGDGKSFFASLLRAVMGAPNVRIMHAKILESDFTGWAEGQCVCVIEEPRLHGNNRYEIVNNMKQFITGEIIEVHHKGKDAINVLNTTSYYMPTNFKDAIPLTPEERRYCVLFSQWQSRAALVAWVAENPNYYTKLYKTLEDSAGALRKWLLEHEVDEDFPAGGDAPITKAFNLMVGAAEHEIIELINDAIKSKAHPHICDDFVDVHALSEVAFDFDAEMPRTRAVRKILESNGYQYVGRFMIEGVQRRFYSKNDTHYNSSKDAKQLRDLIIAKIAQNKDDAIL